MRGTGEAQAAMRRVLGFVSISELVSAVGAPIKFLLAGRLRRVDKSGVQFREPRPIDCVNMHFLATEANRNIVRGVLARPVSINPRGGVDSPVLIGDVLMLENSPRSLTCMHCIPR